MIGQAVRDHAGREYVVTTELGSGGQGTAYGLMHMATGTPAVAKVFDAAYLRANPDTVARVEALMRTRLHRRSLAFQGAPRERIDVRGAPGYVAGFCEGAPFVDHLATRAWDVPHAFALSAALAHAMATAHSVGVSHGDLSAANVLVAESADGVPRVGLIDFDVAHVPGAPAPPRLGTPLYAAPELLEGVAAPSVATDLFALGTLIHEALLGRHPFGSAPVDPENLPAQVDLIRRQRFVAEDDDRQHGGMPTLVVGAEIRRMLRRSLSMKPSDRPSAATWATVLRRALGELWLCSNPACQYVVRDEPSRGGRCPNCGTERTLGLRREGQLMTTLRPPSAVVGRAACDGDAKVSERHLVLLVEGLQWTARDVSVHGTFLERHGSWHRLPSDRAIAVHPGDRLRLGQHVVLELAG